MLMHLKLAGKLAGVRGIVFGEMMDCRQTAQQDYTLEEVVMRVIGDLGIPVAFGMRSGHVSRANITLPIGVRAGLEVGSGCETRRFWKRGRKAVTTGRAEGTSVDGGVRMQEREMNANSKHIHLIGICGTAMASLAGMLRERGHRVTGSDAAAYPPMSTFLESLGIPVAQPFAEKNLDPRPDLVVIGNALSRGNVELERVLDERIAFCSMPQILHDEFLVGKEVLVVAGTHGKTTTTRCWPGFLNQRGLALVPDRRDCGKLWQQLWPWGREAFHSRRR